MRVFFLMMRTAIAKGTGRKQHQRRPKSFAAARGNVLGNLSYQHHIGVKTGTNHRIHGLHVRSDQIVERLQFHVSTPLGGNRRILGGALDGVKQSVAGMDCKDMRTL